MSEPQAAPGLDEIAVAARRAIRRASAWPAVTGAGWPG